MTIPSSRSGESPAGSPRRRYTKPQLQRFGTLAEVTSSAGDMSLNADGGMGATQKTS